MAGWTSLVIWECEARDLATLQRFLLGGEDF